MRLSSILIAFLAATAVAGPKYESDQNVSVSVYDDANECIKAIQMSLERDLFAVAAVRREQGMVWLKFRERLTASESKVFLKLSIAGTLEDVSVVQDPQFEQKIRTWTLTIHSNLIDKTTLSLGSLAQGVFMLRRFKLGTGANQPLKATPDGAR